MADKEIVVEVGCGDKVIVDKLFGPLIFTDIKVEADFQSGCWIISRRWIKTHKWQEICRIPGQYDEEFTEDDRIEESTNPT